MWLCTNYGFFSVVKIQEQFKNTGDNTLEEQYSVRARDKSHLEKGFPNKKIWEYPFSDYEYRVYCTPEEITSFISNEVETMNYTNFKNSVKNDNLHNFYLNIWELGVKFLSKKRR